MKAAVLAGLPVQEAIQIVVPMWEVILAAVQIPNRMIIIAEVAAMYVQ